MRKDNDFEGCSPQSIQHAAHKLHCNYSDLSIIDLSSLRVKNLLTNESFMTENSRDEESNNKESIREFTGINKDNLTAVR